MDLLVIPTSPFRSDERLAAASRKSSMSPLANEAVGAGWYWRRRVGFWPSRVGSRAALIAAGMLGERVVERDDRSTCCADNDDGVNLRPKQVEALPPAQSQNFCGTVTRLMKLCIRGVLIFARLTMPTDKLFVSARQKNRNKSMNMEPTLILASAISQTPAEVLDAEAAVALPLTEFYDTPANLPAGRPGDLLRKEFATEYALPEGTKAQRILYRSLSAGDKDVVTSGVILLPVGPSPRGGWPVIAWAHGTTGVSRRCAPSLRKDYYASRLSEYLKAGFAVVASDYHGLGTDGAHQYCSGMAQGRDILYSIKAARAAEPELGKGWVVAGHSQGSITAWGVAAEVYERNDLDYLGAVAIAGGMQKDRVAAMYSTTTDPHNGGLIVLYAAGVKARFPDFDLASMLTDAGMKHYEDITTKGCLSYAYAVYANVPPNTLLKRGWENLPLVDRWFAESVPGERPICGPIFVITSAGDTISTAEGIEASVARACCAGMAVTFRKYGDLDHSQVFHQSIPDQLVWIKDRLAGKPAPGNCPAK